jgi:hypothetical protein
MDPEDLDLKHHSSESHIKFYYRSVQNLLSSHFLPKHKIKLN